MFEDYLPKRKLGVLTPLAVADNVEYEFYRLVPRDVMLVTTSVGLQEFSARDVERAFEPIDRMVDLLCERGIDFVMQSGVPLPLLMGVEALDRLVERMARRSGKPATAGILGVVRAARHLEIENIVLANKWTPAMNKVQGEFFARGGVHVAGVAAEVMGPAQFQKMSTGAGVELAYQLGRQAFEQFPEADGLYIGGGAWLIQPVVAALEAEFGRPVLYNRNAMVWDALHIVDFWKPIPGAGRLLEGN